MRGWKSAREFGAKQIRRFSRDIIAPDSLLAGAVRDVPSAAGRLCDVVRISEQC